MFPVNTVPQKTNEVSYNLISFKLYKKSMEMRNYQYIQCRNPRATLTCASYLDAAPVQCEREPELQVVSGKANPHVQILASRILTFLHFLWRRILIEYSNGLNMHKSSNVIQLELTKACQISAHLTTGRTTNPHNFHNATCRIRHL